MNQELITRRRFLRTASLTTTAALSLFLLNQSTDQQLEKEKKDYSGLTDFTFYSSEFMYASEKSRGRKNINGTIINIHGVLSDPEANIPKIVQDLLSFNARYARLFIPSSFEPQVGEYDEELSQRIHSVGKAIYEESEGMIETMWSLFDAFPFQHSNKPNPVYWDVPLSDSYLFGAINPDEVFEKQMQFYTDDNIQHLFGNRLSYITKILSHTPGVSAVEIANEPQMPIETQDTVGDLTAWHAKAIHRIRSVNDTIAIVGGYAYPWMVHADQLDIDYGSAHIYEIGWGSAVNKLNNYLDSIKTGNFPAVLITEAGVPGKFEGRLTPRPLRGFRFSPTIYDYLLSSGFANLIKETSHIDTNKKIIGLKVPACGFWQMLTNKASQDGFHFSPLGNPRTMKTINDYGTIVRNAS